MELTAEQQAAIAQQKEHCPFCQIIAGKIPAQKVYEDQYLVAVLDINPARPGHVLILPKEHYPIMPLIPPVEFMHLFRLLPQFCEHLRQAMVARHCSVFIANGPAAGQQSQHFVIHLIPSDKHPDNFRLEEKDLDPAQVEKLREVIGHNLPIMMRERSTLFPIAQPPTDSPSQPSRLAELIEENAEFREMLINNPVAVIEGVKDNPGLAPLFEDVDVFALSERLKEQYPQEPARDEPSSAADEDVVPAAHELDDASLLEYLEEKQRLKELLLEDVPSLALAMQTQPRLQRFFARTTPEQVAVRLRALLQADAARPASLDDLAGVDGGDSQ